MLKISRRLALAAGCTGLLALVLPAAGEASFTPPYTTQCSGGRVPAITTGLQSSIATTWRAEFEFEDTTSPLSCTAFEGPSLHFTERTSSEALEALGSVGGVRNPAYVFAGNEEPPTLSQWLNIDLGSSPGSNSGLIRQIPAAATAVVPIVNFPSECKIPAGEATTDGRFTVSNLELEKVYEGAIKTWGELLPDIAPACSSTPIKRVVPSVSDGTTYVFKQWLATVAPTAGWNSLSNTTWPNDSGATATVRSTGGDEGEAELVAETTGSIGFSSLPWAREIGFGFFAPGNPNRVAPERLFWLSVVNGAGAHVEPTRDPKSGLDNVKGANCDSPTFSYTPSGYDTTVTPVWRAVSAAGSATGWPICTLTYYTAWDDSSTVYGDTEEQQARQRTVKDFLAYVLSTDGQNEAKESDYSPLTAPFLADAQDGQSRVGWNKLPGSKAAAINAQIAAASKHAQA
jgi:ABC-type phosphate transport system substrate-binding protein